MKYLSFIFLLVASISIYGQETNQAFDGHNWEAPYTLPIPTDWTIERFLIPIGFAPQIKYKGVEDIRFTPGWGISTSADYWSYAFLWYLDGHIIMDAATIESNLKAYYTGLIQINGQAIPKEKIIPVETAFKPTTKGEGDVNTFEGTVKMLDYMTEKLIILNVKVHLKSCATLKNTYIFYELSPQPYSHTIWKSLNQLWVNFKCSKD
ncbi:hypothetical protein [Flavihumibacter sp. UBA7668]|uniref:hypothetical protein n=1 Tax=Flavihumibacter sp. UBA7668 TaxID=1946542 RepID=UPI0025C40F17|nr:hypothetical protein [Flavihumibacter sp. UBA7668]